MHTTNPQLTDPRCEDSEAVTQSFNENDAAQGHLTATRCARAPTRHESKDHVLQGTSLWVLWRQDVSTDYHLNGRRSEQWQTRELSIMSLYRQISWHSAQQQQLCNCGIHRASTAM